MTTKAKTETKKFQVLLEQKVHKYITVRAASPEQAAALATRRCKNQTLTMDLHVTYLGEATKAEESGELPFEFVGICAGCKNGVVSGNKPDDREWSYAYVGNEHGPDILCYACATRRNETHTHGGECQAKNRKTGQSCAFCATGTDSRTED